MQNAKEAIPHLAREGLRAFIGGDPTSSHNLNEPMQRALRHSWQEWPADDPAWADFDAN